MYYIIRKRTIDIRKLQIGCPPVKYLNRSWRQQNQTKRWSNKIEDIVDISGLNQINQKKPLDQNAPNIIRHIYSNHIYKYIQVPYLQQQSLSPLNLPPTFTFDCTESAPLCTCLHFIGNSATPQWRPQDQYTWVRKDPKRMPPPTPT